MEELQIVHMITLKVLISRHSHIIQETKYGSVMLHILGFIVHLHLKTEQTITCLFMNTPLEGHGLLGRKASIDLGLSMSFTCRSRTFTMRWTAFCIYHGIANPSKALNLNLWITSKTWEMTTACKDLYL